MEKIKPYIRCVIFTAGIILLIAACNFCFAQTGYINYLLRDVNADETDYDTIVLGASHGRSAIDPNITDAHTGDNTISMSIPSETLKDSYYVLKEGCRNNDVKKVILDVDFQYWFGPQGQGHFQEAFIYNQVSWFSPQKWEYLFDNMSFLDIRNAISQRNTYQYTMQNVKSNINQKLSTDYEKHNIYSLSVSDAYGDYRGKGFFYRVDFPGNPGGIAYCQEMTERVYGEMQDYPVEYFKRIKEYCDEHQIELICVTSPITPTGVKLQHLDVASEKFEKFFSEQGVKYYDFNKTRMDILKRQDTDFSDVEGHMEGHLAEQYSEILGQVLRDHDNGTLEESKYFYDTFDQFYQAAGV